MSFLPPYLMFSATVCCKQVCITLRVFIFSWLPKELLTPRSAIQPDNSYLREKKIVSHVFGNYIKLFLLQVERKQFSGFIKCELIYPDPALCTVMLSDNKQTNKYNWRKIPYWPVAKNIPYIEIMNKEYSLLFKKVIHRSE